ncbi:hypothetical protein LIER_35549 [Lithospermum erythrorhizon]|uniref:Uncharacterized protein n=1 Tax=Lithospermum erythrorhizon TaxID=34254 RepID=A0AAV3NTJ5_LITER
MVGLVGRFRLAPPYYSCLTSRRSNESKNFSVLLFWFVEFIIWRRVANVFRPPTGHVDRDIEQYSSSGPNGRGQLGNRVSSGAFASEPAEATMLDPLIGRKVRTRWPDDNNLYEAVITDYKPAEIKGNNEGDRGTKVMIANEHNEVSKR